MKGFVEELGELWELFGTSFLAAWILAALLALIGVLLFVQGRVFFGAALAQASTAGVALGLLVVEGLGESGGIPVLLPAILASIAAALWIDAGREGGSRLGDESRNAYVFLAGVSGSLLLVSWSAQGSDEIRNLLSSSLLTIRDEELWILVLLTTLIVGALVWKHLEIRLLVLDPAQARIAGLPVRSFERVFSVLLGITIGIAIRDAGFLYVFACLVLPALIARNLVRELGSLLLLAPLLALAVVVPAFFVAYVLDLPPGVFTVPCLVLAFVPARLLGRN